MSTWKQISEQMPEIWRHVLIVGTWEGSGGRKYWLRPAIAFWTGTKWIPDTDLLENELPFDAPAVERVTHWMPLPEGPEEICSNE